MDCHRNVIFHLPREQSATNDNPRATFIATTQAHLLVRSANKSLLDWPACRWGLLYSFNSAIFWLVSDRERNRLRRTD